MQPGQVILVSQPRGHESYPLVWTNFPVTVCCHKCKFTGPTVVQKDFTTTGWILCCLFAFLFWPISCVVCYCMPSVHIYTHSCSNCRQPIGALNQGMTVYYWNYQKLHHKLKIKDKPILFQLVNYVLHGVLVLVVVVVSFLLVLLYPLILQLLHFLMHL